MLNESIEHTHDTAVCKLSLFFELEVMRGESKSLDCALFGRKALRKAARALRRWGETRNVVECFSVYFFRALVACCVLYNRTAHSQGLSIC